MLQLERNPEIPLQLKRSSESQAETREVPRLPSHNSSGAPGPLLKLDRKPEFSAATGEEL